MQRISAPIQRDDRSQRAANVIDCLLFLIDQGVIRTFPLAPRPTPEELKELAAKARQEGADQWFGEAAQRLVFDIQLQQGLGDHLRGHVDAATADCLNALLKKYGAPLEEAYRIIGTVRDGDGNPVADARVAAWDRDLRKLQLLGEATTDDTGAYAIAYDRAAFERADAPTRRAPWLVVAATSKEDEADTVRVEIPSDKATPVQTVHLTLAGNRPGGNEWQSVGDAVQPLLAGQGQGAGPGVGTHATSRDLFPTELTPGDLDFIHAETGLDRAALDAWATASRIVQELFLLLEPAAPEKLEVLKLGGWPFGHALVRQRVGEQLDAVLQKKPGDWSRAWAEAVAANLVPRLDENIVAGVVELLEWVQRLRSLDVGKSPANPLAQVLAAATVSVPQHVALDALPILEEHGTEDPDALLQLHDKHPDQKAAVNALVRGVRVHRLVGGHARLLRELSAKLDGDSDSIAPLARLGVREWAESARVAGVGAEQVLPMQIAMEAEQPVLALQARLEDGELALPDTSRKAVASLVKSDPDKVAALFRGKTRIIGKEAEEEGGQVVKNLGTFGRLGVGLEMGSRLIKAGVQTPAVAMRYGREHLREVLQQDYPDQDIDALIGGFRERIEEYIDGGQELTIRTGNSYLVPAGMYELPDSLPAEARENLPTIPGLFGDVDECGCRSCESMLGQPAYLVDLLELLRKRPADAPSPPLDILKARRPHIFTLELGCENSETPVQHIELVLEILEEAGRRFAGRDVYEHLATQCFPWQLPFNRGRAHANAYLARLGVERAELLRLLVGQVEPERWAAELLDIAHASGRSVEWDWLTADRPRSGGHHNELWELYGLVDARGNVVVHDPVSGEDLRGRPVQDVARRISVLLDRTGLQLEAFEALLATQYVGRWTIVNRAQCKTSEMSLGTGTNALETCLNRIYRMVRLSGKLPAWSFAELDAALTVALGAGPVDDKERVMRLATLSRLSRRHRIPVASLLALPASPAPLCAALDLRPFHAALLQRMTGWNVSSAPVDLDGLDRLLEFRAQVDETGLALEDVACAFLPRTDVEVSFQPLPRQFPTAAQIDGLLSGIRGQLRDVVAIAPGVPLAEQVHQLLREAIGPDDAASVLHAIEDAGAVGAQPLEPARRTRVSALLSGAAPAPRALGDWRPLVSAADADALLAVSGNAASNPSAEDRFTALLVKLWPLRRERTLVDAVSGRMQVTRPEALALLTDRLTLDAAANEPSQAHQLFLQQDFWGTSGAVAPALWQWADRLHRLLALKASIGAPRFDLIAPRLEWRRVLAANASTGLNAEQQRLLDWLWLAGDERLSMPALAATLEALDRSAATLSEALDPLARRFELAPGQVQSIAALGGVSDTAALRDGSRLLRLYGLLVLARTLGADAEGLGRLADDTTASLDAIRSVTQAAVGLDDAAWPPVQQGIEDPVRAQRRDALVAYLLRANPAWRSANDLYEHYLIDPLVGPCMTTTRMLEAISATQLFAQRVLFGLEGGVKASRELQEQWTWMRNYRVWEANRKVHLFPENWLYPELRDDKSASFQLLESALGQGELDEELVHGAFGRFLDDVAQTGQVQVLGMYEHVERGPGGQSLRRDLHVIGRTQNPPYAYYWRKCEDFGGRFMEWLPWRQIELDIDGDHVIPFVLNGALSIAWLQITKMAATSNLPERCQVKVARSRLSGDRWQKPNLSREPVTVPVSPYRDDRNGYVLRVHVGPENGISRAAVSCFVADSQLLPGRSGQSCGSQESELAQLPDTRPANAVITTRLNNDTKQPSPLSAPWPPEFGRASDSAFRTIAWECWVKVKAGDGSGWMRLDASPSSTYTLEMRPLMPGVPSIPHGLASSWLDLGDASLAAARAGIGARGRVEPLSWKVHAHFRGLVEVRRESLPVENLHVDSGRRRDDFFTFEIDASEYSVEDLGLDRDGLVSFRRHAIFYLDESNEIEIRPGTGQLLSPPNTKPWMNGNLEKQALGSTADFTLEAFHSDGPFFQATIFPRSAPGPYFAVPANSNRQPWESESIWHFSEGGAASFIDMAPGSGTGAARFRLLANAFPEAHAHATRWRLKGSVASAGDQQACFGADKLPLPGPRLLADTFVTASDGTLDRQEQAKLSFDPRLPFSPYNWELFFHAPLLIADKLSRQHKFEEAERWLRCIFDPTSSEDAADAGRFLRFQVFRKLDPRRQVIDDLRALAQAASGHYTAADTDHIEKMIARWRDAPFRPFVVARGRHVAFLWRTLFAYVDNLVAWADSLYRRDTRESNNEALMLYVLARKILGRRPKRHQGVSSRPALRYVDLQGKLDAFANFWIDVGSRAPSRVYRGGTLVGKRPPSSAGTLLFCMPFNDKLDGYWNVIEDRLFNLRHCRNIDGIRRELPLTDSPIDPELLVRATAAGLDIGSVVSGLHAPPPVYRYAVLAARATELAAEAKALAAAMLAAMEKRDAEQVAKLRSDHEINLLQRLGNVRRLQLAEARSNVEALRSSRRTVESRYEQYQRLLGKQGAAPAEGKTSGEESLLGGPGGANASRRSTLGLIKEEDEQYVGTEGANTWSAAASVAKFVGAGFHAAASIISATPAPDKAAKVVEALGHSSSSIGDAFALVALGWRTYADHQGMLAGHLRRRDEWAFQSNQALKELQQIDKQILASEIRVEISQKEFDNHVAQVEQAQAVDEVMRSKFTNVQLYEWMSRELGSLHDRTYRLALDMARRAERAAARELGVRSLDVIGNDHWNSLRQGLLAGEKLHGELRQLEVAYLDQNRREFELTRHVSLRRLDAEALVRLRLKRKEGTRSLHQCEFEIPEWLFDLDTPGHYLRRIKSVSVSIPCVTGPHTSVHCTLTQLGNHIRHDKSVDGGYARRDEDPRFTDQYGASEAIVTSTAGSDSGLFEAHLRDERFLPFEGSGVISRWRIELPGDYPQFDYATISDVILTIRYTARDGGDTLREQATAAIRAIPETQRKPLNVLLSSRSEFPTEWAASIGGNGEMTLALKPELLPYWMAAARLRTEAVGYHDVRGAAAERIAFTPVHGYQPGDASVTLPGVAGDLTDRIVLLRLGVPVATG